MLVLTEATVVANSEVVVSATEHATSVMMRERFKVKPFEVLFAPLRLPHLVQRTYRDRVDGDFLANMRCRSSLRRMPAQE